MYLKIATGASIVPGVMMGQDSGNGNTVAQGANSLNDFIKIMAVNSAKQLELDMKVKAGAKVGGK